MSEQPGKKYYGKYRGTVVQNQDPKRKGRLQVEVLGVLGFIPSSWAEPCVPLAGPTGPPMGVFLVPPIGAGVWIEFEHGDPSQPVWVGCRWGGQTDVPLAAQAGNPAAPNMVFQSLTQNRIIISSLPGEGVTIETAVGKLGPRLELTATSVKLSCGPLTTLELSVEGIKMNGEALVVKSMV